MTQIMLPWRNGTNSEELHSSSYGESCSMLLLHTPLMLMLLSPQRRKLKKMRCRVVRRALSSQILVTVRYALCLGAVAHTMSRSWSVHAGLLLHVIPSLDQRIPCGPLDAKYYLLRQ